MAKRPCARPGCHALVVKGYCDGCRPKYSPEARRTEARKDQLSKKWYDSPRWRATRKGYFKEHPLCADIYGRHAPGVVAATELGHKVPHKEDWKLFWDRANWQGLCKGCHSTKTATEDGGFGRKFIVVNI